jgi:hypothetical protein
MPGCPASSHVHYLIVNQLIHVTVWLPTSYFSHPLPDCLVTPPPVHCLTVWLFLLSTAWPSGCFFCPLPDCLVTPPSVHCLIVWLLLLSTAWLSGYSTCPMLIVSDLSRGHDVHNVSRPLVSSCLCFPWPGSWTSGTGRGRGWERGLMVTVGERRGGGVHSEPGGHDQLSVCVEQRYLRRVPVTYLTLHYWVTEKQLNTGEIIMENCYMRYL